MAFENEETTLSFIAEWFDCHPQVTKKYLLKYYPNTNEVEMKETSTRTKFLKRTKMDNTSISKDDFYIGATIIIFSRDLKLVDYGDNDTSKLLDVLTERSICVVLPNAVSKIGSIIKASEENGMTLVNLRSLCIDVDTIAISELIMGLSQSENARESGDENEDKNNEDEMEFCTVLEFRGEKCIDRLLAVSSTVEKTMPKSNNHDKERKLIFASSTPEGVRAMRENFLTRKYKPTARYNKSTRERTCVVIKPHVIKSRMTGVIIDDIMDRNIKISAMQIFHLDRVRATEFYEAYNSTVKEYRAMVDELCSGPTLALEIACDVDGFRNEVAGPFDVEIAKLLVPDSIRAKYGKDRVQNAIHCTDLIDESRNELSYFFDILCNSN